MERRYTTQTISEALNACGLKITAVRLAQEAQSGKFTAKRVKANLGKGILLAATARDVQTYLIITGKGSAPLWLLSGLLDQSAAFLAAWKPGSAKHQEFLDKEFNYDLD